MVKTRQPLLPEFGFRNPDGPSLEIEEFDFADLRLRLSDTAFAQPHRPDFHQIMLVTAGTGTMMIDFVSHQCRPGTLIHVSPGQVQRLPFAPRGGPAALQARMLLFRAHFPPSLPQLAPITGLPAAALALIVPTGDRERITDSWSDLASEYRRAADAYDTGETTLDLLRLLLAVLLCRIVQLSHPAHDLATRGDPFHRFQNELESRYASTRNVAEYAAAVGYSSRTLDRVCHAASGHSPKQLINARVTLEARRLLAHTDSHVATIADQLGFRDPTNFSKFFSRETGTTPGGFRAAQHSAARPTEPHFAARIRRTSTPA